MSLDKLNELLDREAKSWKPNKGDKLVGTVIDRVEIQGDYDPYVMLTVETATGELFNVHCFHNTLRMEVQRRDPQQGDEIGIKYNGKQEGGRFGSFEGYTVFLKKLSPPAPGRNSQPADDAPAPTDGDWPPPADEADFS